METTIRLDMQEVMDVVGLHLNQLAFQNNLSIPQDFTFIKMRLASFGFDDMSFRYKNQFFSILFDIYHNGKNLLEQTPDKKKNFIDFCSKNNLVPCLFPLNFTLTPTSSKYGYGVRCTDTEATSTHFAPKDNNGWNLIHAVTNKAVNPLEKATDTPIQMSMYEQYNFATEIAKQIVSKQYGTIVEWNDIMPANSPQLVYLEKQYKDSEAWCCVRVVNKPIEDLTDDDIAKATEHTHIFNPIFSRNGMFVLVYIKNTNRTDLIHNYQYKIKEVDNFAHHEFISPIYYDF